MVLCCVLFYHHLFEQADGGLGQLLLAWMAAQNMLLVIIRWVVITIGYRCGSNQSLAVKSFRHAVKLMVASVINISMVYTCMIARQ